MRAHVQSFWVLPQHMGIKILTVKYRFEIFLNKGIKLLKNKGIEIGELQVTLMYTY